MGSLRHTAGKRRQYYIDNPVKVKVIIYMYLPVVYSTV